MPKINKINLDGAEYDIERGMLPEVVSSLPATGSEDTMYLVPSEIPGTVEVSGSGTSITLNNTVDAPILDFKLNGNTEQTTYSGKNLSYVSSVDSSSGGSWTITDGLIKNTAYTGSTLNLILNMATTNLSANETAYISCDIRLVSGTASFSKINDSSINYTSVQSPTISSSFQRYIFSHTYDSSKTFSIMLIQFSNLTNGVVEIKNVMVAKSNTAYEPYVGGIASPNPDYPQAVNVVTGEQAVKVEGKNLLPTITGSDTYSGVSLTSNNGTITATGTATANMTFTLTGTDGIKYRQTYWQTILATTTNSVLIPKGTYYFSGTATLGNVTIQYRLVDIGQKLEDGTSISLNSSITLAEDKWLCIAIYVNSTRTPDVNMSALQLELGSQATDYETYRGTDYEVNLGKNLFDYTAITNVQNGTNNGDGTITSNTWSSATWQGTTTIFNAISISEPFTISMDIKLSSGSTGSLTKINDGASNFTSVSSPTISTTWQKYVYQYTPTAGYSIAKFYVQFSAINGSFEIKNIQIEKGTATSFAPYFTPIELCKIGTYQDYIWNDNGTWKVHKAVGKVVLDGTENWADGGVANVQYITSIEDYAISDNIPTSDYFTGVSNVSGASGIGSLPSTNLVGFINRNDIYRFYIKSSIASTPSSLATWLSTHNTTVYYALATPTDTAITESALITQLNALKSARSYSPQTNIMVTASTLPGILDVTALQVDPQSQYDEYVWLEGDQEFELIGQAGAIQQLQRDVAEVKAGSSVTHLIPIIEDGAVWDEWQQTGDLICAAWELLSCDKVSFSVSGTSETMSLQEVFDALENGTEYVFDSLPLDEVDPVILGSNPPEYPEVSGVAVPSRQSFSYVAGPDPATDTINVVFRSGSVESVLIPYNDSPKVCKLMTGVLRQDQTGVESKYLFMLGRVVSAAPIG